MEVLFSQASPIPLHAMAAMLAVVLGAVQLRMKKGGARHRLLGRVWIALMLVVALTSFFIHEFRVWGPFSPIHLLSVLTVLACWRAVYLARVGKIEQHGRAAVALYFLALMLTGLFTLLPGRAMNQALFG